MAVLGWPSPDSWGLLLTLRSLMLGACQAMGWGAVRGQGFGGPVPLVVWGAVTQATVPSATVPAPDVCSLGRLILLVTVTPNGWAVQLLPGDLRWGGAPLLRLVAGAPVPWTASHLWGGMEVVSEGSLEEAAFLGASGQRGVMSLEAGQHSP